MNSEEETFNKLRRVPYSEAGAIYCIACFGHPLDTPREVLNEVAKESLRAAGWTIEELNKEGQRREND